MMNKLAIPSNLSKIFCVNTLVQCGIKSEHDNAIQSKLENSIMVDILFFEQAKTILEQCSIVKAREYLKQ